MTKINLNFLKGLYNNASAGSVSGTEQKMNSIMVSGDYSTEVNGDFQYADSFQKEISEDEAPATPFATSSATAEPEEPVGQNESDDPELNEEESNFCQQLNKLGNNIIKYLLSSTTDIESDEKFQILKTYYNDIGKDVIDNLLRGFREKIPSLENTSDNVKSNLMDRLKVLVSKLKEKEDQDIACISNIAQLGMPLDDDVESPTYKDFQSLQAVCNLNYFSYQGVIKKIDNQIKKSNNNFEKENLKDLKNKLEVGHTKITIEKNFKAKMDEQILAERMYADLLPFINEHGRLVDTPEAREIVKKYNEEISKLPKIEQKKILENFRNIDRGDTYSASDKLFSEEIRKKVNEKISKDAQSHNIKSYKQYQIFKKREAAKEAFNNLMEDLSHLSSLDIFAIPDSSQRTCARRMKQY